MFQNLHHLLQSLPVGIAETVKFRAVDVQNTVDFSVLVDGNDDLGIGGTVAGNMSGESMDIGDKLGAVFFYRFSRNLFTSLRFFSTMAFACFALAIQV